MEVGISNRTSKSPKCLGEFPGAVPGPSGPICVDKTMTIVDGSLLVPALLVVYGVQFGLGDSCDKY